MELPGFALDDGTTTAYAQVRTGRRLVDDAPVRVEVLRSDTPVVRDRLRAAEPLLRRADARHLARVRQVLGAPPALVREDVPGRPPDRLPPERAAAVVADVLDALAVLHELGLTHGSLGAADVLLDEGVPLRPVVRLTGWGLAALVEPVPPTAEDDVRAAVRLLGELGGDTAGLEGLTSAVQARDELRRRAGHAVPAPRAPRQPVPWLRPLAASVAAVAVLGLGLVGGRLLAAAGDEAESVEEVSAPAPAGPYVFPLIERSDGLVVERSWLLEQDGAVLRGTTVVRNPTLEPRSAGIDEVIPKSVADDVDDLVFTPGPDAIVQRDPVVRFNVRDVPAGGSTRWSFVVRLPEPVQQSDLPGLAADAEAARASYEQWLQQARAGAAPAGPTPSPTS